MKSIIYKYSVISLLVCCALLCSCEQEDPKPNNMQEAVDNIINPYIVLGADVGIIVGVIKDNQKMIYSYGEKKTGTKEKITAQSVLEIASLTKVYTALALADMQQKGLINIDDPIEEYLPSNVKVPSFNGKKITLRQLANHTSGLPSLPDNIHKDAYNPYKDYTEQNMFDFINSYTLKKEPGTEEAYSNTGYGLLGLILSTQNHTNFETMITSRVLQPLGMTHTTVSFTNEQLKNLVPGYNGNRSVESWSQYQQNIFQGAGSLISSMDDQLIFLEANMGLTKTPLDDAIVLTHKKTFEHTALFSDGIALGWTHFTSNGEEILWKNGGNGCYSSFIGFNKTTKIGVVILVNSSLNPEAFSTYSGFQILEALKKL